MGLGTLGGSWWGWGPMGGNWGTGGVGRGGGGRYYESGGALEPPWPELWDWNRPQRLTIKTPPLIFSSPPPPDPPKRPKLDYSPEGLHKRMQRGGSPRATTEVTPLPLLKLTPPPKTPPIAFIAPPHYNPVFIIAALCPPPSLIPLVY